MECLKHHLTSLFDGLALRVRPWNLGDVSTKVAYLRWFKDKGGLLYLPLVYAAWSLPPRYTGPRRHLLTASPAFSDQALAPTRRRAFR